MFFVPSDLVHVLPTLKTWCDASPRKRQRYFNFLFPCVECSGGAIRIWKDDDFCACCFTFSSFETFSGIRFQFVVFSEGNILWLSCFQVLCRDDCGEWSHVLMRLSVLFKYRIIMSNWSEIVVFSRGVKQRQAIFKINLISIRNAPNALITFTPVQESSPGLTLSGPRLLAGWSFPFSASPGPTADWSSWAKWPTRPRARLALLSKLACGSIDAKRSSTRPIPVYSGGLGTPKARAAT